LLKIRNHLISEGCHSFGVYGLGGVGKTQLIQKYIQDYGSPYSNVFWIIAADVLKLSTSYKDIAFKLGLRYTEEVPNSSREAFRTWLDTQDDWLLVFDNANSSSILAAYLPSFVRGHLLTASRGAEHVENRRVGNGIVLKPLSIANGAECLLRGLAGSPLLEDESFVAKDAAKVSKRLGGHPLTLSHAASSLTQ
jgi:NB-ARC domain